jgi:hypothetical protein
MEIRGDLHRLRVFNSFTTLTCMFFFLVILSVSVLASTTIEITPSSIYEGTEQIFNVTIITSHNSKALTKISFEGPSVSNVQQTNSTDFNQGWNISSSGSTIFWENNTIPGGSFVIYTYLQFTGTLSTVGSDASEDWTITTTDSKGKETTETTDITIMNDASPPVITNPAPSGQTFFKPAVTTVSATITDPESGVGSASFAYNECGGNTTTQQTLTANSNLYSKDADFSSFSENDVVCYTFTATSNGGESSTSTGNFTIDNTAPILSLVGPDDDTFITGNLTVQFDTSDVLSPTVNCDVLLNSTVKNSLIASQSSTNSQVVNTTDGTYTWQVQCQDLAENKITSASRTIKIDNTPPTVSFTNAPKTIIRGSDITAQADVIDFSGISNVRAELIFNGSTTNMTTATNGNTYIFSSGTTNITALGAYQIKVYADDTVGHSIASTTNNNLTYNYVISLSAADLSITPGGSVGLSGSVIQDDGTAVGESNIQLLLPGSNTTTGLHNQTGAFSHSFTAPSSEGIYTVIAQVTAANGITYNQTLTLTVENTLSSGGSGSSSGPANSRTLRASNGRSVPSTASPSPSSSVSSIGSSSAGTGEGSTQGQGQGASPSSAPSSAPSAGAPGAAVTGGAVGVGAAGGFLRDRILKYSKLLWTMFVVVLVIGSLVYISRGPQGANLLVSKKPRESKPSKELTEEFKQQAGDLDDYLRERLK